LSSLFYAISILPSLKVNADVGEPANPILIIVNVSSGSFSTYTGEILKAEGFNEFQMAEIGQVNTTFLASFDTVILTTMSLTTSQATMIEDFVSAGGGLIAFKPDLSLTSIFGLVSAGTVTSEGYIKVDNTTDIGKGIITDTMQFHGEADNYNLNGAAAVAALYSDAATPTPHPAVTTNRYGYGQAVFFAYDFPESIVLLRQGNPAYADAYPPGGLGGREALYVNYLDATKIPIPQADEQMRLLTNAIMRINYDKTPLPRLWYFPDFKKTMLIFTGDMEWANIALINDEFEDVEARSGAMSLYLTTYSGGAWVSPSDVQNWTDRGHEIGWHVVTGASYASMENAYATQFSQFNAYYGFDPIPTIRHHGAIWFGYVEPAKIEELHGIRMDFNGYHVGSFIDPGDGLGARNGWMTGSGLPMRFADQNGTIVDVYQIMTEWPDDILGNGNQGRQSLNSTQTIALVDKMFNQSRDGFYSAFCANFHPVTYSDDEWVIEDGMWWPARERKLAAQGMLDLAQDYGIPIWSGEQFLSFTDAREMATFNNITYHDGQLNFDLDIPAETANLTVMIPYSHEGRLLQTIVSNSSNQPFVTDTIKGIQYALFKIDSNGTYNITVSYGPDTIPPEMTILFPVNGSVLPANATSVVVTVRTDENADCRYNTSNPEFDYLTEGTDFASGQGTLTHSFTFTGLQKDQAYSLFYKARDASGNINGESFVHTFSVSGEWLAGWKYRKSHVINGVTSSLTAYQFSLTLHYGPGTDLQGDVYLNSHSRTDFGDVRFTDADGTTLVSYWFEEIEEGIQAKVWIKVPTIPAAPSSTSIYLYYGNPDATSVSNGKNTFIDFFGSREGWTGWTGGEEVSGPSGPGTSYYNLSSTVYFPVQREIGTWYENLHTFQPVHKTNITEVNLDGYKYWAYWCDPYGNGIGLARSNDLVNWDRYNGNPILYNASEYVYRWPSVTYDGSVFHMFLDDYAPFDHLNFIKEYTSTDGISFSYSATVYENPGSNIEVVNPFIWFNPNDNKYYLYFGEKIYGVSNKIRCKIASTLAELATAPVTDAMNARDVEFSPSILYDGATGLYWLITEENIGSYFWVTRAYYSSTPLGGFVEASNSPILSNNDACAMHFWANNKVYLYYCQFVGPNVPVDWDIRLQIQGDPSPAGPDAGSYQVIDTSSSTAAVLEGQLLTHAVNFVCEYKTKNVWTADKQLVQYLGESASKHYGALLGRSSTDPGSSWWYFVDGTGWIQLPAALVQNQWHDVKRMLNFADHKEEVYIDGVYQGYYTWRQYDGPVNSISHVWFALGEAEMGTMWVDSFRTRQYVSTEPSQGAWGSEEQKQYVLTVTVIGSGSVSKSPDQSLYDSGTVVTLNASANFGWTFAGWSGGASGMTNPTSVTMNSDKTVFANFTFQTGVKPTLNINPYSKTGRKFNETFTVQITIAGADEVEDFEFEIEYNATMLHFAEVSWTGWGSGTCVADDVKGILTGYTSGSPLNGNATLVTVTFNATYHHMWKDESQVSGWKNIQTGTMFIQKANLSYLSSSDLRYERGGINQIDVGPDFAYTLSPIQGDLDNNGKVEIFDLRTIAALYGTVNSTYDLTGDNFIDIFDIVVVARNFSFTYP